MNKEIFYKIFSRIEYFYNIHMYSYHTKIANLAYEEYAGLFLEIIDKDGEELIKSFVKSISNKGLLVRILIFMTAIDLDWAKTAYKDLVENSPIEGSASSPTVWNNFIDQSYLIATKKFLQKTAAKRKLKIKDSLL